MKIEKNGVVVCQVQTRGASQPTVGSAPGSPLKNRVKRLHPMQLDPDVFREFWVSYGLGEIRIGHGSGRRGTSFVLGGMRQRGWTAWTGRLCHTDVGGVVGCGGGNIRHVGLSVVEYACRI